MAYDEFLAERIKRVYEIRRVPFIAKKMFGGVCFLVNDKMCAGVLKQDLMVRIDPEKNEKELKRPGASPMDFSGKSMKGFIMIDPLHVDMDDDLEYWIDLALEFNPRAKASKK
ncbi:MAG: TfoX/Sxy family protein [Bacteroidales bacterium]|jgi:TfoX/Sxy family transcriptional regulator of competence genes